jgi:hypothetical protein
MINKVDLKHRYWLLWLLVDDEYYPAEGLESVVATSDSEEEMLIEAGHRLLEKGRPTYVSIFDADTREYTFKYNAWDKV